MAKPTPTPRGLAGVEGTEVVIAARDRSIGAPPIHSNGGCHFGPRRNGGDPQLTITLSACGVHGEELGGCVQHVGAWVGACTAVVAALQGKQRC